MPIQDSEGKQSLHVFWFLVFSWSSNNNNAGMTNEKEAEWLNVYQTRTQCVMSLKAKDSEGQLWITVQDHL